MTSGTQETDEYNTEMDYEDNSTMDLQLHLSEDEEDDCTKLTPITETTIPNLFSLSLTGLIKHELDYLLNILDDDTLSISNDITNTQAILMTFSMLKQSYSLSYLASFSGLTKFKCKVIVYEVLYYLSTRLSTMDDSDMPAYYNDIVIKVEKPACLCCRVRCYSYQNRALVVKVPVILNSSKELIFIGDVYPGKSEPSDSYKFVKRREKSTIKCKPIVCALNKIFFNYVNNTLQWTLAPKFNEIIIIMHSLFLLNDIKVLE